MDHARRSGAVQSACGKPELGFGFGEVSGSDGYAHFLYLRANRRLDRSIAFASDFILTETLFGTRCVWHDFSCTT
jgi:hypothetical protein